MAEYIRQILECDICKKEKSKYTLHRFKRFDFCTFESERFDICDRCLEVIREKSREQKGNE